MGVPSESAESATISKRDGDQIGAGACSALLFRAIAVLVLHCIDFSRAVLPMITNSLTTLDQNLLHCRCPPRLYFP
jgi:hypothetical protein